MRHAIRHAGYAVATVLALTALVLFANVARLTRLAPASALVSNRDLAGPAALIALAVNLVGCLEMRGMHRVLRLAAWLLALPLTYGGVGVAMFVANGIAPNWQCATILVALLPVGVACLIWYAHLPRRHPAFPPACRRCRYDLTGNTSGTCPECGTAVG